MKLSPEQFEAIVEEVMRRLAHASSAGCPDGGELTLNDRLITTHTLDGRLIGVRKLIVDARAIITPAAQDLLRDNHIEVSR